MIVEEIVAQLKLIKQGALRSCWLSRTLEVCSQLADRHYIIERGVIVYEGDNAPRGCESESASALQLRIDQRDDPAVDRVS